MTSTSLETKICTKCGATWIGGQHYWTGTGKLGDPHDLAGLVCNNHGDETCINPCKGSTSGDTWEHRLEFLNKLWDNHESSDG
jgi:hypothetical protein|tara:strand:+ start:554 stop:802 length:249 start_codon:yes stop_codon:yes gene_type:complete